MNKYDTIKRFIRFLKEKNVFYTFRRNYDKNFACVLTDVGTTTCREYLNCVNPYDFIGYAFDWLSTDEGHAFWNNLDDKWRNIVKFECS